MAVGRVNYGSWFFRVLGWDGVMPVCVALIPTVINFLIPVNRGAIEITAVFLPIAGFLIRFVMGARHISTNHCTPQVRRFQVCAFCLGIFLLVFVDALLILSHVMPKGALFANQTDRVFWVILISAYLTSMAIAMYPGRMNSQDDTAWPQDAFDPQEM